MLRLGAWCRYNYGNAFYAIDVGPLHFISLNCYGPTAEGTPQ